MIEVADGLATQFGKSFSNTGIGHPCQATIGVVDNQDLANRGQQLQACNVIDCISRASTGNSDDDDFFESVRDFQLITSLPTRRWRDWPLVSRFKKCSGTTLWSMQDTISQLMESQLLKLMWSHTDYHLRRSNLLWGKRLDGHMIRGVFPSMTISQVLQYGAFVCLLVAAEKLLMVVWIHDCRYTVDNSGACLSFEATFTFDIQSQAKQRRWCRHAI